jgi:2-polyprenyl-6-hydroxyphenyl methylase/3-demethylubiquinone-9 3-methyltransferase
MYKSLRWRVAQFFESRWWRNYLSGKDVATYLSWKKGYWDGVLDRIGASICLEPGQRVLDAGCGPAGIFINLQDYPATAFDPLIDTYENTLPHFKRSMYPGVTFYRDNLESFRSAEPFDVVFCMNAINHVSQLGEAFDTLVANTRPGGKVVVSIDAHNHPFFKFLFRIQPADVLHPHQYDLKEYEEMLTSRGVALLQAELIKKEFLFNHYILVGRRQA